LVKQQTSEASGVNFLNYSSRNGHQVALPYWQSHMVAISGTIVVKVDIRWLFSALNAAKNAVENTTKNAAKRQQERER